MNLHDLKLSSPPIVEAILDIECDIPPQQQLAELEQAARAIFRDHYPKFRTQVFQQHQIEAKIDAKPKVSSRHGLKAFQFLKDDEKQLVQVRDRGYSFNRLAPYTGLDDYLPEIERTWNLYIDLVKPVQIRSIRLRYINRIVLPLERGGVDLDKFFKIAPRLTEVDKFSLTGFLNQYTAVENETGNHVNIVLTAQSSENGRLPVIFDNTVIAPKPGEAGDWPWILDKINVLRVLKNRVFREALTESCLDLFQKH